jgi:two-component system response regulator HydG
LEGELFGHVRGAFTDAKEDRTGRFEAVGAGTLLLDEIGDIEIALQAKLLRVIEEREFTRVGENKHRAFNARLICATAMDLDSAVSNGRFRADLLGRINQFRIAIPPLRDRPEDTPLLAWHFLQKHARGQRVQISPSAMRILEGYSFPMNVRQLENASVEALARCDPGTLILPKHLPKEIVAPIESVRRDGTQAIQVPQGLGYAEARDRVCRQFDRIYLLALLHKHHNNQSRAAEEAGIDRKTFAARLAETLQAEEDSPHA